ncbi:MAG: hypothetical protein JWP66_824 [Naasia sp.]|nr:hypothetical protein [Naasia sp.]
MSGDLLRFPTVRSDRHLAAMDPMLEWNSAAAPRRPDRAATPGAAHSQRRLAVLTGIVAALLGGGSIAAAMLLPWY